MAADDKTQLAGSRNDLSPLSLATSTGEDPLLGRVLKGAYRLEAKIGEGGMGVVYRATQIALGRVVAVKLMPQDRKVPGNAVERFFREAKLLSQLQHPHIVTIIDFGTEADSLHFMVMEYLHGEPLDLFVKSRRRLDLETILQVMEQLCAAIEAAHQQFVIHRDLKPSNVYLIHVTGTSRPSVKVLDFGLGKALIGSSHELTREGVMMGTLCYSAPEQLGGGNVDTRADIYSLGGILYFLVAGRSPFLDDERQGNLILQLSRPPEAIDTALLGLQQTRAIEAIIHKAMSPSPCDRYQSATSLYADLARLPALEDTLSQRRNSSIREVPAQVGAPASGLPAATASRRWTRRGLLGLGAAAAAGGLGVGLHRAFRPASPGATAPGVSGREVVLGMSAPFSGPTEELGRGMQAGIETFFATVNQSGGVHGRTLRLVALDDRYEPAHTRQTMQRLLDEYSVFAFIGNVGTPTAEVALPIAIAHKRIFFAAFTGARLLRAVPPDQFVFNYRASYTEETAAMVRYLLDVRGLPPESIAVMAQNDGFGQAGFEGVARALRDKHVPAGRILRVGYERNTNQVGGAVETILARKDRVKAVVLVATYSPAALFIKGIRSAGSGAICSNVSFVDSEALAEEFREIGPQYGAGVIVTQVVPHFNANSRGVVRYRQRLRQFQPSAAPGFVSLEGYIAANLLAEGLRRAGPNLTTESLIVGLEGVRDLDLGIGTLLSFGESKRQASHKVWGSVLSKNGTYDDLDLD